MSVLLENMKRAEDRMKASLYSAIASTVITGLLLVIVLAFGVVLAIK